MQRVRALATVVGLAFCSTTSSFVIPAARGRSSPAPSRYGSTTTSGTSAPPPSSSISSSSCPSSLPHQSSHTRYSQNDPARSHHGLRRQRASCMYAEAGKMGDVRGVESQETNLSKDRDVGGMGGVGVVFAGESQKGEAAVPDMSSLSSAAPARTEIPTDVAVVGAPQQVVEKEYSIEAILKELAEIQNQGPKNYCVLGTRHCSFLHQQIIELLAYALVLSGNHVFTSGAMGTNAATIRGALRAERKELLTVVLPQSLDKQSEASRELIQKVTNVVTNPQNDHLPLDAASRLCNSDLLSRTEQLICFAFHDSKTIIETSKEARSLNMIVTELYLD